MKSIVKVAAFATLAMPLTALAHTGTDGGGHHGFLAGAQHPLTGPDHLAAMLAVGFWSALVARKAWPDLLWAPLAFATLLLVGALAGLAGLQFPAVEPMIAASVLVLGLLTVTRLRLPGPAAAALVGGFAVFHGMAHGQELAGESMAVPMLLGMLVATAALHVLGIAAGWALRGPASWVPRLTGMGVALLGLGLLAQLG
jgi:urease accessory protein